MLDPTDTIAAVASPAGPGFRGIVRVSGPAHGRRARGVHTRARRRGRAPGGPGGGREGSYGWTGFARPCRRRCALAGPATYTGQPFAELHTVGSPPLLQHCWRTSSPRRRLAEPGEFTLRAFLRAGST